MKTLNGPLPGRIRYYLMRDKNGRTEHLLRLLAANPDVRSPNGAVLDFKELAALTGSRSSNVKSAMSGLIKRGYLQPIKLYSSFFKDKDEFAYRASGDFLLFIATSNSR